MSIEFKKPSIDEVYAQIQKELKDIPLSNMDIRPRNGIEVKPIYHQANRTVQVPMNLDYRIIFQYFKLDKSQVKESNKAILHALANGQNGLQLDFNQETWNEDLIIQLFKEIRLDYIHIEFCKVNAETKLKIQSYLNVNFPDLGWAHSFFEEHFINLSDANFIEDSAKTIHQFNQEKALIYIELSGDYFWDLAKIRAFKTLIYHHRKLSNQTTNFIVVAETSLKNKSKDKLETNILKLTTEAMSAMIGGCEGLWIRPFNDIYDEEFSTRISRNIFHLMQEESYLHLVSDPSAGSYFIENYSEQIAKLIYTELTNQTKSKAKS